MAVADPRRERSGHGEPRSPQRPGTRPTSPCASDAFFARRGRGSRGIRAPAAAADAGIPCAVREPDGLVATLSFCPRRGGDLVCGRVRQRRPCRPVHGWPGRRFRPRRRRSCPLRRRARGRGVRRNCRTDGDRQGRHRVRDRPFREHARGDGAGTRQRESVRRADGRRRARLPRRVHRAATTSSTASSASRAGRRRRRRRRAQPPRERASSTRGSRC